MSHQLDQDPVESAGLRLKAVRQHGSAGPDHPKGAGSNQDHRRYAQTVGDLGGQHRLVIFDERPGDRARPDRGHDMDQDSGGCVDQPDLSSTSWRRSAPTRPRRRSEIVRDFDALVHGVLKLGTRAAPPSCWRMTGVGLRRISSFKPAIAIFSV